MKKICISFFAAIIFFYPLQVMQMEKADAAILTKAATQAGKKMLKEVITDATINQAANMAILEAQEIADKYSAKTGYKLACPDGTKTCTKPVQVKVLNETDKIQLKAQVAISLDNQIAGGINATRFGKFIDWFVPLWAITAAGTALDYIINGDDGIAGLMRDVGNDALTKLGFIVPAVPVGETVEKDELPVEHTERPVKEPSKILTKNYFVKEGETVNATFGFGDLAQAMGSTTILDYDYNNPNSRSVSQSDEIGYFNRYDSGYWYHQNVYTPKFNPNFNYDIYYIDNINSPARTEIKLNNVVQEQGNSVTVIDRPQEKRGPVVSIGRKIMKLTTSYVIMEYYLNNGDVVTVKTPHDLPSTSMGLSMNVTAPKSSVSVSATAVFVPSDKSYTIPQFVPQQVPMTKQLEQLDPIQHSKYKTDSGFKVPPIDSVTYKDSATGEPLVIEKNPNGENILTKPNGDPVPDDNIIVEDGNITEKPGGDTVYTPVNPSPQNPGKTETVIPLQPKPSTPTTPPVSPPTSPPADGEPIPDGPSCEEKFKFPILSPLKETFSTSFPFSIPWDIERAINAAFSGIGHEKPKFNLDLNVLGQKETIEITTPKMFDDWKPFTDTLLVLTFDVLIMFGVYRFVKGAGS